MKTFKCSLWCIITVFIELTLSFPLQETNAERFAKGLPPNPPKFIKSTPPTPASGESAKHPSPSPSPRLPVTLAGRLQVRSNAGIIRGHVRNSATGGTISGINVGTDQDLLVKLTYRRSRPHEFNILATNPQFPSPFYVGAGSLSTASVPTLIPGVKSSISFMNVESTPPGSRPVIAPTRKAYVNSAIWSIDPTTHQLRAQWINNDGSKPPTVLAYDNHTNFLFFVSDIHKYNASAVHLFLVPA